MKIIGEKLSNQEMLSVKGGITLCCYCGFVGGSNEGNYFNSTGGDVYAAIYEAGLSCGGQGATCNGEAGPEGHCPIEPQ